MKRSERLESMVITLSKKMESVSEQPAHSTYVRKEMNLPFLRQLRFNPMHGYEQHFNQTLTGLPKNVKAITIRFGLTDMNVRRSFKTMSL